MNKSRLASLVSGREGKKVSIGHGQVLEVLTIIEDLEVGYVLARKGHIGGPIHCLYVGARKKLIKIRKDKLKLAKAKKKEKKK